MKRLLAIGVLAGGLAAPAGAADDLQRLTSLAYHQAETAAMDLRRIDDAIGGLPDGPRRAELVKQRGLLEAQLRRELESIGRLARKIDELERRVAIESHLGVKMPGMPIEAHPAGPEPVVPDLPLGPLPPPGEPEEGGGGVSPGPAPVGPLVPAD